MYRKAFSHKGRMEGYGGFFYLAFSGRLGDESFLAAV